MNPSAAILSAMLLLLLDPHAIVGARAEERASRQPLARSPAATLTVDLGRPVHSMRGGLGASWHALGPTVFHYPDLVNRDNRTSRGSAFGGNPPLRPDARAAWQDVLRHARWLGLDFIRVEVDMRMYNPRRGEFTWDNEEMETLDRILEYCQSNHVDVFLTMMWQDVDWNAHPGVTRLQSAPRSTADFAESYAVLIERLVKAKGYTCVRWITFSNEPGFDGCWWLGPDRKPASITPALHAMRAALDRRGLQDVAVCGPDGHTLRMGQFDPRDPAAGALSVHDYNSTASVAMYREGVSIARERGIPFFVSEFGHFFMGTFEGDKIAMGSPRSEAPRSYAAQLLNAEKILVGLNEGVDGFSRWSFVNRGDLDGQWQLVRTWNPTLWDYHQRVTPEPVPYFSHGILTRFTAKRSTVLAASSDDADVVVTALRSPGGQTTLLLLNKSRQPRDLSLRFLGLGGSLALRQYQTTEAALASASFTLSSLASVDVAPASPSLTVSLPGRSLTAYTTFQLADDADGITQE